jgi:hypothetical protein
MFNTLEYLEDIQKRLKLTAAYTFTRISSIEALEGVISGDRKAKKFFAVDDSQEGMLYEGESGGWFERRPIMIMLLNKLDRYPDMDGRTKALDETRIIYKKIISKIVHDRDEKGIPELTYFDESKIPFNEIAGQFANGSAGIYFTFTIDVPVNMKYDESDWN